jgi:Competence protein CoiA-like family
MLYAITDDGKRIRPEPNLQALCPGCRAPVIAKCGEVNIWHWSHVSGKECDPWYEPETAWHLKWKEQFEEQCREVVIGPHRADVQTTRTFTSTPYVIELQHSPIDVAEIQEREDFYGKMLWLLDGAGFKDHCEIGKENGSSGGAIIHAPFRWKWQRKSWRGRTRPLYLDFGDCLWQLLDIDSAGKGTVRHWTYHEFLADFAESVGNGLPIRWRETDSGGMTYRFGLGHVLIYKDKKGNGYKLAVYHQGTTKPDFRPGVYGTIGDARRRCEPHMGVLMKQSGKFLKEPRGE